MLLAFPNAAQHSPDCSPSLLASAARVQPNSIWLRPGTIPRRLRQAGAFILFEPFNIVESGRGCKPPAGSSAPGPSGRRELALLSLGLSKHDEPHFAEGSRLMWRPRNGGRSPECWQGQPCSTQGCLMKRPGGAYPRSDQFCTTMCPVEDCPCGVTGWSRDKGCRPDGERRASSWPLSDFELRSQDNWRSLA
jgi:hypothetical protein